MQHHDEQIEFLGNERGASSLEYGLLIALIGAVVATALTLFGPTVAGLFRDGLGALSS